MSKKLISILCEAPHRYRVQLRDEDDGHTLTFDFNVIEHNDIDMVQWSDEYAAYIEQNFGPYKALLEAILQFHLARKVDLP